MKVAERVLERRLRQAVDINKMQFGFRSGTGITDAIIIARQLQERYKFIIVMEAVTQTMREGLPWEMLYAEDLVFVGKCEEELTPVQQEQQ